MFKARFWSSVVIVAVILFFGFAGGPLMALFLGTISCIGYLGWRALFFTIYCFW